MDSIVDNAVVLFVLVTLGLVVLVNVARGGVRRPAPDNPRPSSRASSREPRARTEAGDARVWVLKLRLAAAGVLALMLAAAAVASLVRG